MERDHLDALLVCGNQYAGFEGAVRYVSGFEIVHRYVYVLLPLAGEPTLVFPAEARWIGDKKKPWVREQVWAEIPGRWLRDRARERRLEAPRRCTAWISSWRCAIIASSRKPPSNSCRWISPSTWRAPSRARGTGAHPAEHGHHSRRLRRAAAQLRARQDRSRNHGARRRALLRPRRRAAHDEHRALRPARRSRSALQGSRRPRRRRRRPDALLARDRRRRRLLGGILARADSRQAERAHPADGRRLSRSDGGRAPADARRRARLRRAPASVAETFAAHGFASAISPDTRSA